ncbi:MAG: zinc-binding dehydrogenase [Steroidobacteraceae bacterium]
MRAIELNAYGAARDVLEIARAAPPTLPEPNEVLIAVKAASVNPVDCAIRNGYGKEVFRSKGQVGSGEFPIRLGRDAAGIIEAVGSAVHVFRPGDRVFAAPTGAAMAEFITVDAAEVALAPASLDFVAAASIPFVAMTAWNALVNQSGLSASTTRGKRVVIARGAGGVGSFAIQLMKAWGAWVATTCSTGNIDFVRELGADVAVDYRRQRVAEELHGYDAVLNGSFDLEQDLLATLKTDSNASYVTITSPKVRLADEFGLEEGFRRADAMLAGFQEAQRRLGRRYCWGFMKPDGAALGEVAALIAAGKIRPIVDRVYPAAEIVAAHEYCESGRARGKIVIDFN